jgi:hypothetical protein
MIVRLYFLVQLGNFFTYLFFVDFLFNYNAELLLNTASISAVFLSTYTIIKFLKYEKKRITRPATFVFAVNTKYQLVMAILTINSKDFDSYLKGYKGHCLVFLIASSNFIILDVLSVGIFIFYMLILKRLRS